MGVGGLIGRRRTGVPLRRVLIVLEYISFRRIRCGQSFLVSVVSFPVKYPLHFPVSIISDATVSETTSPQPLGMDFHATACAILLPAE